MANGSITKTAEGKHSGMAVASFVLGILSLAVCLLGASLALPAIILGHIAYHRARKEPDEYGGSGFAIAGFTFGYASLVLTLLLAPTFAKSKFVAERISCAGQLAHIGTDFRVWSANHGDRFPFNVPGQEGGTLEFATQDGDGFDTNAWRHFQVLSNELVRPAMLLCPADIWKKRALSFTDFGPDNVSYQLHTGTNVDEDHPNTVLARCPIHNVVVLCDGTVQLNWTNATPQHP
jgi:hypothetical protein